MLSCRVSQRNDSCGVKYGRRGGQQKGRDGGASQRKQDQSQGWAETEDADPSPASHILEPENAHSSRSTSRQPGWTAEDHCSSPWTASGVDFQKASPNFFSKTPQKSSCWLLTARLSVPAEGGTEKFSRCWTAQNCPGAPTTASHLTVSKPCQRLWPSIFLDNSFAEHLGFGPGPGAG